MGSTIFFLILIGLLLLGVFLYVRFFKIPKIKNIVFIDGALGTGKSFYSVYLAVRLYKRSHRRWRIASVLLPLFKWIPACGRALKNLEEPLLYSNICLRNIPFVRLTKDLLYRQNYRFSYYSVLLIDEASLLADQYLFKDRVASERLSNFFKLFRHECRGNIVINSQSVSDLPYSIKYSLSDYLYLHHMSKWPFFCTIAMQEMAYCGDPSGNQVVNVRATDIEDANKIVLVPKRYFKYYDSYCYSIFTDMLPVYKIVEKKGKYDSLKSGVLLSFKEYKFLTENLEEPARKEGA